MIETMNDWEIITNPDVGEYIKGVFINKAQRGKNQGHRRDKNLCTRVAKIGALPVR